MQKNHYPLTGEQAIDKHPLTIRASLPVTEALAAMIQAQASCALVVEQQQLVGIFTERDAVKFTAEEMVWEGVSIASVMTQELITLPVTEVSDIFSLVGLLRSHRIRHLPIVAEGGQVVGLVTPKTIRNALTPSDLLRHRQVAEVMRTEVIYAPPAVSIVQVAQLITAHRVSCKIQDEKVALLRERNRELEQFAYIASHDLQEPLRGVKFFTHLLTEQYQSRLDAKALKYVYLNEWFEIVTGLPRQKLIGHSAKNIFPKDYQQYFAAERATERGRVWSRAKLSNQGELGVFRNSQRLIAPSHPKDIPV